MKPKTKRMKRIEEALGRTLEEDIAAGPQEISALAQRWGIHWNTVYLWLHRLDMTTKRESRVIVVPMEEQSCPSP